MQHVLYTSHDKQNNVIFIYFIILFQMLLNSVVDMSGSECLNESDDHVFAGALSVGKKYLESDCDEQVSTQQGKW